MLLGDKKAPDLPLFLFLFFLIEQRRTNFLKTVCKGEQHLSRHLLDVAPFERLAELHPACAARFLCDVKLSSAVGCNRKRSAGSCEVNCVRPCGLACENGATVEHQLSFRKVTGADTSPPPSPSPAFFNCRCAGVFLSSRWVR